MTKPTDRFNSDNRTQLTNWNCPYCKISAIGYIGNETHIHICAECEKIYIYHLGHTHKLKQKNETISYLKKLIRQNYSIIAPESIKRAFQIYIYECRKEKHEKS